MNIQNNWRNLFTYVEKLGHGGNANVYGVTEKVSKKQYALKELKSENISVQSRRTNEIKNRFINEIKITKENSSTVAGMLPIFQFSETDFWYTMPVAQQVIKAIKSMPIETVIKGVVELSETLEVLHAKGITHRDIKPANIYRYKGRFCFGDFGLVDFPDKLNNLTRTNKGLGSIFTIAPEMKRNPKKADGKKADVYSLAKTMWMFLTEDEKGFDGVYNFSDASHNLRSLEKYKDVHLIEIEELLKDSTENNPDMRPKISEFKERLNLWLDIFNDEHKSQISNWKFLNTQLFGILQPASSAWTDINTIINILNIIGMTPAYNHMLYSEKGGLDFQCAKMANEDACIEIWADGFCHIVKPKRLVFEGFGDKYRWNYFLLELAENKPILNGSVFEQEVLVEDIPGRYVSASSVQYGVYEYETGIPLPKGHRLVYRYISGKFLIVMKFGPYNGIGGTYDGRHGLCNSNAFRKYVESLIFSYTSVYGKLMENDSYINLREELLEKKILNLSQFNKNPFRTDSDCTSRDAEQIRKEFEQEALSRQFITDNYFKLNYKESLIFENYLSPRCKFCFKFTSANDTIDDIFCNEKTNYFCYDGLIRSLSSNFESDCYFVYNRTTAVKMKNTLCYLINAFLLSNKLSPLEEYDCPVSIQLVKCGNPSHLFTKNELAELMRNADDRVNNRLVIDEDGYAKIIPDNEEAWLYPVRHEVWCAGNVYVGKYSKLSTLDDDYLSSLQGWLSYLRSGHRSYIDYVDDENLDELLSEISKFYLL